MLRSLLNNAPHLALSLVALALALLGVVMVFSASLAECFSVGLPPYHYAIRQLAFAGAGGAIALLVYRLVPISAWTGKLTIVFWLFCLVLMVAVAFSGENVNGATRWLDLGAFQLQPSEFMKIAVVLMVSRTCANWLDEFITPQAAALQIVIACGVPLGFMALAQSDLGTSVVCAIGVLSALLFAGVSSRILAPIVGVGVTAVTALTLLVPYRRRRLELMLNPWNDGQNGLGDGYQMAQSFKTIAEGGLTGLGLGASHQTFGFLPECHTDFIFAVIAAELGWFGCVFVVILFLCLLCLGLRLARQATSTFGYVVTAALTVMIVFQAFLNMACVMGAFPLTGKPLPLVSYGGSSMISTMFLLGIVLSSWRESHVSEREYRRRRENLRVLRVERNGPPPSGKGERRQGKP